LIVKKHQQKQFAWNTATPLPETAPICDNLKYLAAFCLRVKMIAFLRGWVSMERVIV
jgi:hypothetical protein